MPNWAQHVSLGSTGQGVYRSQLGPTRQPWLSWTGRVPIRTGPNTSALAQLDRTCTNQNWAQHVSLGSTGQDVYRSELGPTRQPWLNWTGRVQIRTGPNTSALAQLDRACTDQNWAQHVSLGSAGQGAVVHKSELGPTRQPWLSWTGLVQITTGPNTSALAQLDRAQSCTNQVQLIARPLGTCNTSRTTWF